MSKATSVLIVLKAPLRFLPQEVMNALSAVLFQWIEGGDEAHARRWRRMWRRLFTTREQRPSLQLWIEVNRSRPYHARWMATEERIFDSQEGFYNLPGLRWWLKTGAGFGRFEPGHDCLLFVPSSLSWEDCSDDEMREFVDDVLAFLRTPHALAQLWPQVAENRREDMLDACLTTPTKEMP